MRASLPGKLRKAPEEFHSGSTTGALVALDDVDREMIALRDRPLTDAQATGLLDGTALVRSILHA